MYFDTWLDVWTMGGHGGYVWASFVITSLILVFLVWAPLRRTRRAQQRVMADHRRRTHAQHSEE
jgi:heme exporter protein CcmD